MVQINNRQSFNLNVDIEELISIIKAKPPATRTKLDKEILKLWDRANAEGEAYCFEALKNRVKEYYSNNKIVIWLAVLAIAAIAFKKWR